MVNFNSSSTQSSLLYSSSSNNSNVNDTGPAYSYCFTLFQEKLNGLRVEKQSLENTYLEWSTTSGIMLRQKKTNKAKEEERLQSLNAQLFLLDRDLENQNSSLKANRTLQKRMELQLRQLIIDTKAMDESSDQVLQQLSSTPNQLRTLNNAYKSFSENRKDLQLHYDEVNRQRVEAEQNISVLDQEIRTLETQENSRMKNNIGQSNKKIENLLQEIELFKKAINKKALPEEPSRKNTHSKNPSPAAATKRKRIRHPNTNNTNNNTNTNNHATSDECPIDQPPREPDMDLIRSSPLHALILQDSLTLTTFKNFLERSHTPEIINQLVDGWSPLHLLIEKGNIPILLEFFNYEPNLKVTVDHWNALQYVAFNRSLNKKGVEKIVGHLINHGGLFWDVPVVRPPAHIAAYNGNHHTLQALIHCIEGISNGKRQTVRMGDFINQLDAIGHAPIHYASLDEENASALTVILNTPHRNVNLPTGWAGNTALMLAAEIGNPKIQDLLIHQQDINIDQKDPLGKTALDHAQEPSPDFYILAPNDQRRIELIIKPLCAHEAASSSDEDVNK